MSDEPDGYAIVHNGANFSVMFGPFNTLEEAEAWLKENPTVSPGIVPLYKTVDWNRGI